MIETLIALAMKFWKWSVLIALIIIGFLINLFDKNKKTDNRVNFKYEEYPHMTPIRIATKDKGFWGAILMWLLGVRHWEIVKDFHYKLDGQDYVIPAGFKFDGASIPKFLASFLSPVGVLLIGGLIHDYAYKYSALLPLNKDVGVPILMLDQKKADEIFRDINIEINGFYFLNYLAYYALRLGGFFVWNKHRKVGAKI